MIEIDIFDARCVTRECIRRDLSPSEPANFSGFGAGAQSATRRYAEKVEDDISLRRNGIDTDQSLDANHKANFFFHFAYDGFPRRFVHLDPSTRKIPRVAICSETQQHLRRRVEDKGESSDCVRHACARPNVGLQRPP